MTAREERAAFDRRYAPESVRIAVLTGEATQGASNVSPDELWTRWVDVFAWVDEQGTHLTEHGRLSWMVTEDQRATGTVDLAPLSQYDVRVRRAAPEPAAYPGTGSRRSPTCRARSRSTRSWAPPVVRSWTTTARAGWSRSSCAPTWVTSSCVAGSATSAASSLGARSR